MMQDYGLSLVTGPTVEPVSLAEAASHLRMDVPAEGDPIHAEVSAWIAAARQYAEKHTGRRFGDQTWKLTLDEWPGEAIRLPGAKAIASVVYVDAEGDEQTLDASTYQLRTDKTPTLLDLAYGQSWPNLRGDAGGIRITFACGETCPETVKAAIKLMIGWHDRNREGAGDSDYSPAIRRLLDMESTGLHYGVA